MTRDRLLKITEQGARGYEATYANLLDALNRAEREVFDLIAGAIAQIGNPNLVRGRVAGKRVKTIQSVIAKCKKKGIQPDQILSIPDLVGIRVVCANHEDITRLVQLVKGLAGIDVVAVVKKKTPDGYRAVHIDSRWTVDVDGKSVSVPCELQIRTLYQDSWAVQTHRDLYKSGRIPPEVRKQSKELAKLLDVADGIAQRIRETISERKPRKGGLPVVVTEHGLGLIYQRAFGQPAPEYLLRYVKQVCEDEGIDRLDALDRLLGNEANRARLGRAYGGTTLPDGRNYVSELIFQFAPMALRRGVDAAVVAISKRAAAEDAELDRIYRHEVLSDLPKTFAGFMKLFERVEKDDDPAVDMERYASGFGVLTSCSQCGCSRVSEYDFASEIQRHYRVKNREDEILKELWACGADTCRHCGSR